MCGLAGSIADCALPPDRMAAAQSVLARRGPDSAGATQGRLGRRIVNLVHTRLAIIDLDPRSAQPFIRDGLSLVLNGEIYNYLEVRAELRNLGHVFTTNSDTEVVLEAYRRWGADCVARFEGMWALALLDEERGRLWLSRDRFGEKPLFLWRRAGTLYFASEVKALAALAGEWPDPDLLQVSRFLVNGYKALGKKRLTWFEGIEELPAAHSLMIEVGQEEVARPTRYWSLAYAPRSMSRADAVSGVRDRLLHSLELRLRADVPLAFCLSGGIDSGVLAGAAVKHFGREVHAFSVVDTEDARYDERDTLMQTVAHLGCKHHMVEISRVGFLDRLARQVAYRDGPVITLSYYVHEFLSQAIAEAGYKVAISGTGADELLTGYYDHYGFWLAEMSARPDFEAMIADWRDGYGKVVRNPVMKDPLAFVNNPAERRHIYLDRDLFQSMLRQPLDEDFFEKDLSDNLLRRRMLNELFEETVPVMLAEDDRDSMYWSVENRSPFLDRQLAEFAYAIPNEHLIADGMAKFVLRAAGESWIPDTVRLDKRKRGFNASIDSLLDRADSSVRERLLGPGPIFDIVDRERFSSFLEGDMSDNSLSKFLFGFVSARLFLETSREAG